MNKELEFKIKVVKHFDVEQEAETTNYYVKKKRFLGWWYVTKESSSEDEWFPLFFGTLFLDTIIVSIIGFVLKLKFEIDIINFSYFFFSILSLRTFWYLMSFKIMKRDFYSKSSALDYIKDRIRKSNLEEYHSSEDIKITYKNGNLEVEK